MIILARRALALSPEVQLGVWVGLLSVHEAFDACDDDADGGIIGDGFDRLLDGSSACFFDGVACALSEGGVVFDGVDRSACLDVRAFVGVVDRELIEKSLNVLGCLS
jgi:hypothetical protein